MHVFNDGFEKVKMKNWKYILRVNNISVPIGEVAQSAEGVNNIAQADENNNSMSLRGANATWQSTTNKKILKQVRNDKDYTLSLVGEGRMRYEQNAP